MSHRRRTDLDIAGPEQQKLDRVTPVADAADRRNRQSLAFRVPGKIRHHVQRDRLHRGTAVTAMRTHLVDSGVDAQ